MKQKKWLLSICALAGLLVLCVGVYTVLDPGRGDISGTLEGTPAKSETSGPADSSQPGADLPDDAFEAASSWVNWSDEEDFYLAALNSDKLAISSVRHLPVFCFETAGELEGFKERFAGEFAMEHEIDEFGPSFADVTEGMDEAYFEDRTVFVVYVPSGSGSYRFGVDSVYRDSKALCIHIKETGNPEVYTCDMAGWFVVVSLEKALVEGVTDIDADMNHLQSYAVANIADYLRISAPLPE